MPNSFSRTPKLLKGALVELVSGLILPIPNVIVFQYNPSQMRRSLGASNAGKGAAASENSCESGPGTAQACNPTETIDITLELDAADDLENPDENPVAVISGVADRLAAVSSPNGVARLGVAGAQDRAARLFRLGSGANRARAGDAIFSGRAGVFAHPLPHPGFCQFEHDHFAKKRFPAG
jgi:hypothetical protein